MSESAGHPAGRYDAARRRRARRTGRERGCWVFVPAEELRSAGLDPHAPAPSYRVWGRRGGSVLVRLYRVTDTDNGGSEPNDYNDDD